MNDLNHPKVTPLTRPIASQLQLDSTFVTFVFAEERPECFRYWCENVDHGWTCFIPDNVDQAYPLWSTNADQTLVLVSRGILSYAKGYHDNPDIEMISETSQGLLADLLNKIWESDASDEEMEMAARFCGFRFLNEYFEFVNVLPSDADDWQQRWRDFIARIDAKRM